MKTILTFDFSYLDLDLDIQDVNIINPPFIPLEGQVVNIKWRDFIGYTKAIEVLEDLTEDAGECLVANMFSVNYEEDKVIIRVLLYTAESYEKDFITINK